VRQAGIAWMKPGMGCTNVGIGRTRRVKMEGGYGWNKAGID